MIVIIDNLVSLVQNIDRRRQKQKYNLYEDDEYMEIESQLDQKILSKYDEEIEGEKKSSFQLGMSFLSFYASFFVFIRPFSLFLASLAEKSVKNYFHSGKIDIFPYSFLAELPSSHTRTTYRPYTEL